MVFFESVTPFLNQSYSKLKQQCVKTSTLFVDPLFPASDASLGISDSGEKITWKRPPDIATDPHLFVDGLNPHDVCQGDIGDCWLVSSIAGLACYKEYWKKVIPDHEGQEWDAKKPENYQGIFRFRFWRYGEWVEVVIDDQLPVRRNHLIFVSSSSENEFWSALLEKAYAKMSGGYGALVGGHVKEALVDFTGGVPEYIGNLRQYLSDEESKDDMFTRLVKEANNHSLICASISSKGGEQEGRQSNGLVTTHAYTISAVREVTTKGTGLFNLFNREQLQMMRLRNPWGEKEWNGPFSDGSDEWNRISSSEKSKIGLTFDEDGEFWMAYDDFLENFSAMTIVHIPNTSSFSLRTTWQESIMHGHWTGEAPDRKAAIGGRGNTSQYYVQVEQDEEEALIHIMQEVPRRGEVHMAILIVKTGFNRQTVATTLEFDAIELEYHSQGSRSLSMRRKLSRGAYIFVPFITQPPALQQLQYFMRIYTTYNCKPQRLTPKMPKPTGCFAICRSAPNVKIITRLRVCKAMGLEPLERGKPDPYVVIECEGLTFETKSVKDTTNPVWEETFLLYRTRPLLAPIVMKVYNSNILVDDFMGKVEYAYTPDKMVSASIMVTSPLTANNPAKEPRRSGQLQYAVWHTDRLEKL